MNCYRLLSKVLFPFLFMCCCCYCAHLICDFTKFQYEQYKYEHRLCRIFDQCEKFLKWFLKPRKNCVKYLEVQKSFHCTFHFDNWKWTQSVCQMFQKCNFMQSNRLCNSFIESVQNILALNFLELFRENNNFFWFLYQ